MNLQLILLSFAIPLVCSSDYLSGISLKPSIINDYIGNNGFKKRGVETWPGVYKLRGHALLCLIMDLLIDWDCHNKLTLIILDPKSGFSPFDFHRTFNTKPQYNCQKNFLSFPYQLDDLCSLVTRHRYIVVIGEELDISHVLLKSKCPSLFLTFHTWIIVNSQIPTFIYDKELVDFINPWQSQMTILIPDKPNRTVDCLTNVFARRQNSKANGTLALEDDLHSKYETLEKIEIFDAFFSNLTSKPEVIKFADWTSSRGLNYLEKLENNYHMERMLRGRLVRLTTVLIYPYTILDDNFTTIVGGIMYDPFNTIQRHLNVDHQVEVSKDPTVGTEVNGNVTGYLGVLQRGEADVSLCLSAVRKSRLKAGRYGPNVGTGYMQMVFKRPEATIPLTIYVNAFQPGVWLTTLGALIVVLLALATASVFSPHNALVINRFKRTNRFAYYIVSGEFIELAFDRPPGWSSKVVQYTLLTSTLMTFVYYCSIFTSLLAVTEIKLPFETFEELVERKDYEVLTVKASFIAVTFEQSVSGVFKRIWQKFVTEGKKGLLPGFLDGLNKILTGKYVFIGETRSTMALSKGSCEFIFAPSKYFRDNYHLTFRRDFPYWKLYAHSLIRFHESGIMNRQQRIYLKESDKSCDEKVSLTLNIYHVFTLFSLLALAFIVVALVLAFEKIHYARTHRHTRSINNT